MVDFHTHILPKMDDGSRSSEESVAMLRMLAGQGIKRVVLTITRRRNPLRIS